MLSFNKRKRTFVAGVEGNHTKPKQHCGSRMGRSRRIYYPQTRPLDFLFPHRHEIDNKRNSDRLSTVLAVGESEEVCWGETPSSVACGIRASRKQRLFSAKGPPGMSHTSPASSRGILRTGNKRLAPSSCWKATNLSLVPAVSTAYAHSGRDFLVLGLFLL